jgi:subtilisin family serine protease
MSGTSMATPAVAGAVACIMAADLSATCANTNAFVSKLSNPDVTVRQGFQQVAKPLLYLPANSAAKCP